MEVNPAISDILKFSITLVSIINPLGAIPVFLGFTKNHKNLNIKNVTNTCAIASSTTILVSLVCGQFLLNFFGISVASFTIGGGLLLFMMAFSMISGQQSNTKMNNDEIRSMDFEREIGIIPLAIPLLSGPGAISTSIIHAKNFTTTTHWIAGIVMVVLIGLLIKIILSYAENIGEKLGQIGLNVMTRIMGLILLSMSIEMIAFGIKEIIPVLKGNF
ncbi:MAG: NAAT family transporter [Bacteriovoracaceae bacterium]|nr:NAAT family transporter [Bacteriovoracaceae bacterium]